MKGKIVSLFGLLLMLAGALWYGAALSESAAADASVRHELVALKLETAEKGIQEECATEGVMPLVSVEEKSYVGILEIQKLALELPVLSQWSEANGKVAPCRYSGAAHTNDMILCAHNYDSHFGRLEQLNAGDEISFTDGAGNRYNYHVSECLIVKGSEVEKIRAGEWDLTLFTCTAGGRSRVVIRCVTQD